MGLLTFEDQVLGNWKGSLKEGEKFTIRRQQCTKCNNVLALQLGKHLNQQSQSDYYVAKDCVWIKGEAHLMYDKKRWFGNFIRCPVCKQEGNLPMDKPLNWELIESKEGKNVG